MSRAKNNLLFPYQYSFIGGIGKLFIPIVPVQLKTAKGLVEFNFIVDTGADLTTLPFYMASQMNIDLNEAQKSTAEGIGGFTLQTWITTIDLHLKSTIITVRASITNENTTPFLLGRVDFLDTFYSWNFNSESKKIQFEEL